MSEAATPAGKSRVLAGARLRDWTSFRLGGPCRAMYLCVTPDDAVETVRCLRNSTTPVVLLGGGTNVLVADDGIAAAVVRFHSDELRIQRGGGIFEAEAGAELDAWSAWCAANGWAGMEFAAGIPGTIGGAVAVNAGAFGRQMSDVLAWVDTLDPSGAVVRRDPGELGFSYRQCACADSGHLFLRVGLRLAPGCKERLSAEREEALSFRQTRHPDWRRTPCAGSFFRNVEPTSAAGRRQAAGWFLERAGVTGMMEGGARVFERHCNIIVADRPGALARDVHRLSVRMAEAVAEKFDLRLEPEVRRIGRF